MQPIVYRRTTVRFISSSDNADYGVTLAGTSDERRVTKERDGTLHLKYTHGITAEQEREYLDATVAYLTDEHAKYEVWAAERDMPIEPMQPLNVVTRVN